MIFADLNFYQSEYLRGRVEVIPFSEFMFWAEEATNRINWRGIELYEDEITHQLKRCTCNVAEALYVDSEKKFMAMEPSQSVGAYSKGAVNIRLEQGETDAEINAIIQRHLTEPDLFNMFVYRGL